MQISVLMVVRNEEAHITECLRSLSRQTKQPFEILIIDHNSTDKTYSLIRAFQHTHPELNLKVVRRDGNHLGRSRQELLSLALSPLVAFIDGDCVAPKTWLSDLLSGILTAQQHSKHVVGVGGPNRLPESTHVHQAINLALDTVFGLSRSPQAFKPQVPTKVDHLATTNCLFLKDALYKVGGFSSHFAHSGEDLEIGHRLRGRNYQVALLPRPIVINSCAQNFSDWLSRMARFGKAQAQLQYTQHKRNTLHFAALILPAAISVLGMALAFNLGLQLLMIYLLLSLVVSVVLTGSKASTRLAVPYWITVHLSPLFYSYGYWQSILGRSTLAFRQKFSTNILTHLKRGPTHAFRLLIGMFQSFFQTRTDTH